MIICTSEAVIDMFSSSVPGTGCVYVPIPGGCAYNTSIAISRLGVEAAFLGRISKSFFGEMQIKRLRENNVKESLIVRCEENTLLAFINVNENKEAKYAFYEEGTADRFLSPQDLAPLPDETTCIMFGSISMAMEPMATTIENLILKKSQDKIIAFDPNIRPFMIKDKVAYIKRFEKWVAACTIVKISQEDFDFIESGLSPEQALEKLLAMGTRLSIITLGSAGCQAMLRRQDGNIIKASAPAAAVANLADTVGAGDTFHGAFLAWLERNSKMSHNAIASLSESDLQEALTFANKAAAIVCTRKGAEPPFLHEMQKIKYPRINAD